MYQFFDRCTKSKALELRNRHEVHSLLYSQWRLSFWCIWLFA